MLGSSRVAAQLAASREGLGSMSEYRICVCEKQTSCEFDNQSKPRVQSHLTSGDSSEIGLNC
jgi:hypothetical protein